ncbi:MAG: hypothetical protein GXO91_07855 [FCB group bacterium]|nr:hypothetical protein [FCB group bacterium]
MRRSTCIYFILTISATLFATGNRVQSLGNFAPMIRGDVQNLYFFPQVLPQHNLLYIQGVGDDNTQFMFTLGAPESRWGIASGRMYEDNFITAIHSLDENRAVGFEFKFNTLNHSEGNDMTTPEEGSNKYIDFALNGIYGWNSGSDELAVYGGFSRGPGWINYHNIQSMWGGWSPNGTFNYHQPGDYYGGEGSASTTEVAVGARIRRPHQMDIMGISFSTLYANAIFDWWGSKSQFSSLEADDSTTDREDLNNSNIYVNGDINLFNQVTVAGGAVLFYALGADIGFVSGTTTDKIGETEQKNSQFFLGGPNCNVGFETDHKFGHFRFGLESGIDIFFYDKSTFTDTAEDLTDETKETAIGHGGYYDLSTGWGANYGNLYVDISLNQMFWTAGPQMIFNGNWGTLGGTADIYYLFDGK